MPDYSTMTNAELITELESRDTEIADLTQTVYNKDLEIGQLYSTNTSLQSTIDANTVEIADLNTQLDESEAEIESYHSSDGVIGLINGMTSAQKKTLQIKARTTSEGVQTFRALNYGV